MRNVVRWLVLALVATLGAAACDAFESSFLPNSPGEKLYRKLCAECHGVNGSGNTPRFMGDAGADLLDDSWRHGGGDASSIEMVVREGVFGKMPGHPELSAEETRQIVQHVLALRGEH
jgi:mono/diheme cytochrome c family protein